MHKEVCYPKIEVGIPVTIYKDYVTESIIEGTARPTGKTSVPDVVLRIKGEETYKSGRIETWYVDLGDGKSVSRPIRVHLDYRTMNREQREGYYVELYFATHISGCLGGEEKKWSDIELEAKIKKLLAIYSKGEKIRG